ncbi:MAG: hypothetical protein ACYC63_18525 [Armatimonadota bacterium]
MRNLVLALMIAAVCISPCCVWAQDDDDGWAEIEGLMNGLTAANQQLLTTGGLSLSNTEGSGLTPGFLEGLAAFSQTYARVLQSIDGAFDVDGAGVQSLYDPFAPGAPNPLWEQFDRWQGTNRTPSPQTQLNLRSYRNRRALPQPAWDPRDDED